MFRLDDETIRLLDEIKSDFGLSARVDALRLAVRLAARTPAGERIALAKAASDLERLEKRAPRRPRRRP